MKRRAVFNLFGRLGLARLMLRCCRCLAPKWLTALAYHRVCDVDPHSPWDPNLVSATPDQFRRQLAFVKRHFTPVTSADIIQWRQGRFDMPPNPLVITFDDGYRDNVTVALPLLQEAGIRADFFICPWHIENQRLFWWDRIAFCVREARRGEIALDYPEAVTLDLSTETSRRTARRTALRIAKRTMNLDIQRFVDEFQERAGALLEEREAAGKLLMTWDHVRALRRAGMGVGSHSFSHRVLSQSDEETTRREMAQSKIAIETALDEPVSAFAYPVGSFSNGTKAMAREVGYDLAYSYCSGASFLRSMDMFEVKRAAVERDMSLPYFRTLVAAPFLA